MRRSTLAGMVLALLLAACAGADSQPSGYRLSEFTVLGPETLAEGPSSLMVSNSGEFPHTLVVAREDGTVVTATDLIAPGETVQLELDLSAGSYQFSCRIVSEKPTGELVDHFEEGMVADVVVES